MIDLARQNCSFEQWWGPQSDPTARRKARGRPRKNEMTLLLELLLCLVVGCSSSSANSDVMIRIRTDANGRIEHETIYVKGVRRRTDYSNDRRVARILHCDTRNAFMVDLDLGQYSEITWPWLPSPEDSQKAALKKEEGASRNRQNEATASLTHLVDTGERKVFFDRIARRLVAQRKHPAWSGPPSQPHREVVEDVTEAWYVHLPVAQNCEPPYILDAVVAKSDSGAQLRLSDFPVKLVSTTRYKIFGADGKARELTTRFEREVVELSTETLDHTLFEVPAGFTKVRRVEIPQ